MPASQVRTDLALERAATAVRLPNITQSKRGTYFQITQIDVPNDAAGIPLGKPKGRYVTLEAAALSRFSDHYQEMTEELAQELSAFLPEGEILVVCLGNQAITPDALGPRIAGKLLATRHLQTELQEEQELSFLRALRPVSVFTPGVLGQTGMESAALTAAVCKEIQPAAVLVIDALACSALNRLGTTAFPPEAELPIIGLLFPSRRLECRCLQWACRLWWICAPLWKVLRSELLQGIHRI